ncbi:MAG: N-acetylmuramoyl-L-alanine amidase [Bacteroidetes bacterium]|nr:N-acetylmuramoyl-L-alanine amidase [Bacteroidota bacterium]
MYSVSFRFILVLTCFLISVEGIAGGSFTIKTIVIDAGHGGKDPGAIGPKGTKEKDVALAVALKIGDYIQSNYPNVKVVYTRKTDVFLELHERAEIANKNKADLFIAVHCNSNNNPDAYGSSTYVLGLHRTEANLEVAKRENSVILLEEDRDKNYEFDPNTPEGHIIMSMKQNAFLDQSIEFASKIENQMENGARRKSMGVKQAGFYVLYKTAMPSLLAEIGFISNPEEEKYLTSEKGQDQIAHALFNAFKDYKMFLEKGNGGEVEVASKPEEPKEKQPEVKKEPVEEKVEKKVTPEASTPTKDENSKTKVVSSETIKSEPVITKPETSSTNASSQNAQTIKKPIEVRSGGGNSTSTAVVQVKPSSSSTSVVEKEPVVKATEIVTPPPPPVIKTEKAPPVTVKKEEVPEAKTEPAAVFKIQLFALKGELGAKDRDKLIRVFPNYSSEPTGTGFIRYYGASAGTFSEAKKYLIKAISSSYSGAFIAGFRNGKRMSADEMKVAEGK